MSQSERWISIGGGVEPFWGAYTNAPQPAVPGIIAESAVTQHGAGVDHDGYVDIRGTEQRTGAVGFVEFDTTLRVNGVSVPLVSSNRGTDWFSCFSVFFSLQLATHWSKVSLNVNSLSNTENSCLLSFCPTKARLLFDGADVDITSVMIAVLANVADRRNTLTIDVAEFHIIARHIPGHAIGSRAMFELRCGFYQAGVTTEIYRTTRLFKTTEMFRSSFVGHMGDADVTGAVGPDTEVAVQLFDFELGARELHEHAADLAAEPEG